MKSILCVSIASLITSSIAFKSGIKPHVSKPMKFDQPLQMADPKKEPEKEGWDRLKDAWDKAEADPKKKLPPIYEPGPYPFQAAAALAYVIPIIDASDLGKYMFEAYPQVQSVYNSIYGPLAGVYNGVPFLPFAVFFLMSYICRAPTFPVEVRFHVSQAFMLALIQFVPSILFGFLEKAGVPMAIPYNTVFMWVTFSAIFMQILLLNPLSSAKNPMLLNVVNWSMKYMGYSSDMAPRR
eukprot:CAMPEP_0182416274 /NCGR_PEP_ID=MMETSP1167-20130531/545_1 /TAXON_ID=2988 /ORGANISM="Mallomonas Sp, Strain CCMP3275" /LENGTH=237 /DNA_ID=CAMNT_0024588899 /DNA_START=43 /DNA_END=756 /DNA_ORIENTATION=+